MRTVHRQGNLGHKEVAISLLRLASSGNVREAYEKYIGPTFHHHNPYFKGDGVSLMNGVKENAANFPGKIFEVQRALEVGDLVAVHFHVQIKPDDRGLALVHIFRFRNDRITGSRRSLLRSALARN